jgi:hypothetical protein
LLRFKPLELTAGIPRRVRLAIAWPQLAQAI